MYRCTTRDGLRLTLTLLFAGSVELGRGRLKRRMRRRVLFRRRPTGVLGGLVLAIEQLQVATVVARLHLFPQRLVIFRALEHFLGHFYYGNTDVVCGGGGTAATVVVVIVVRGDVSGGTAGDGDRSCVLCLGDGMLDEPRRGDFVDCELPCGVVIVEYVNKVRYRMRSQRTQIRTFGRILGVLDFIEILSYSVLQGDPSSF